jgi:hemoglobin
MIEMKRLWSLVVAGSLLAVMVGVGSAASSSHAQDAAPAKKPLYDRLGGVYPIAVVVDDFLERVLVNDTVNANPAVSAARDRVPKQGLKFQITALVCQVTGGPYTYHGQSMVDAHKHLGINGKEWDAMVVDFKASLAKYKVPEAEQQELLTIVGSTKGDIVTK